jgi:hypothetical protein
MVVYFETAFAHIPYYDARSVRCSDLVHPALYPVDIWCPFPGVNNRGMKATAYLSLVPMVNMPLMYIHAPVCLRVVLFNRLSISTTFPAIPYKFLAQKTTTGIFTLIKPQITGLDLSFRVKKKLEPKYQH